MIFNNEVTTIGALLVEQRSRDPDAKVCYYIMQDSTSPGTFDLELKHKIVFIPARKVSLTSDGEPSELFAPQTTAAATIPFEL